ncbi:MAG: Aldehyde dehydrogenase [Sphaerisporangium sp.]|nr:Aldehyde dehydrogenase [Sphaerisporangium sp.]
MSQEKTSARSLDVNSPERPEVRGLFIDGQFRRSTANDVLDATNPATEKRLAQLTDASPEDLDMAVQVATEAQREWASLPWQRRSRQLARLADALEDQVEFFAQLDTADSGNPIGAMRDDVMGGLAEFRYYAGLASEVKGASQPPSSGAISFSERSPYGVVGRLIPYNHPFKAAIGKIGAPLATGNGIILKPSEHTSLSALELARVSKDFLPDGILSVLTGRGLAVGAGIVAHPDIPRISFTGSVPVGTEVLRAAATGIKHVTVELGGKNPFIVFPDADIKRAAAAAVKGMNLARSSGQSCQSTSRIYVHSDVKQMFVDALLEIVQALRVGDPRDEKTDLGPLSFEAHYRNVLSYIAAGRAEGATLLTGGGRPADLSVGYYVEPTVFDDVSDDMTIAREEIFGPVMSILEWRDVDDVIARANASRFGLTANIWSLDISQALTAARRVEAGYVFVNSEGKRPLGAPFGGWKSSGLGKGASLEELLSYTREKAITVAIG